MSLTVSRLCVANGATVSFELARGGCLALSGPSGSGKSLILRALADLDPHSGSVALDGRCMTRIAAPEWRRKVMYVPPNPAFWKPRLADHLTNQPPAPTSVALAPDRVAAPLGQLSTGERQRGALIRALQLKPRVLLADEPSAALDPENTAKLETLLAAFLGEGGAIVLVTHDPDQAARLATQQITVDAA
ncbi:MAG: ABC transporter ATP-binding protein [Pseudomonadota bacterium]